MKENAQRIKLVLEDLSPYTKSRTFYYCANGQAIQNQANFVWKIYLHICIILLQTWPSHVHMYTPVTSLYCPFHCWNKSNTTQLQKAKTLSCESSWGSMSLGNVNLRRSQRFVVASSSERITHLFTPSFKQFSLQWKLFRGKTNQHSFKQPVPYLLNPLVVSSHFCWDSWITSTKMLATSKGLKLHIKRNVQHVQYIKICLSKASRIIKRPLVTLHKLKQAWKQQSCWE